MSFSHKDLIRERLISKVEDLVISKNLPVVIGHICWGELRKKGSFRMSHTQWNTNIKIDGKDFNFSKHVNKFGRNKTFLDLLLLHWFSTEKFCEVNDIEKKFQFKVVKGLEAHISLKQSPSSDYILEISQELSNILLPKNLINKYIAAKIPECDITRQQYEFILESIYSKQYQALEFLLTNKTNFEDLDSLSKIKFGDTHTDIKETSECLINSQRIFILGAIQSALVFVKASFPDQDSDIGFISRGVAFKVDGSTAIDNPMIILSTTINQSIPKLDFHEIKSAIQNFGADDIFKSNSHNLHKTLLEFKNVFDSTEIYNVIDHNLSPHLKFNKKNTWTQNIIMWKAFIIQNLRNSIHEGNSLNFTFIVGDISEIEDSGLFELQKLNFTGSDSIFLPWGANGNLFNMGNTHDNPSVHINPFIEITTVDIVKKNYSWFQEGRYALLWDATFPSLYPHSLIRLKNNTWDVLINEVRNGRGKEILEQVLLSVVFLRQDQSGGIIIKDRLVSSFRKGSSWIFGMDKKEAELNIVIKSSLKHWDIAKELGIQLSSIINSISSDPNSGCILVISTSKPSFDKMGDPWKINTNLRSNKKPLQLSDDELIALMSMDGASCIYLENNLPVIDFRNILMVDRDKMTRKYNGSKLDGEGSRKWSSLNIAKMEDIDLVISVSQDGPIHIYYPEKNELKLKIL